MPLALVITMRSAPVSRFWTVTVTPGSTAPELSTMTPSIEPLAACDCADAGTGMRDRSSRNTERRDTEASWRRELRAVVTRRAGDAIASGPARWFVRVLV